MNKAQTAAYVQAMQACAMIEALGMQACNQHRQHTGHPPDFMLDDFTALIEKYGIHHNAVITLLNGASDL